MRRARRHSPRPRLAGDAGGGDAPRGRPACPAGGAWVADGNYAGKGGDIIRGRADTIVWLDLGDRESLRDLLARDPERSILRWAWTRHGPQRAAYTAQADDRWVRLTSRADVRRFLADVAGGPAPASSIHELDRGSPG